MRVRRAPKQKRNYVGTAEQSVSQRRMTPASLYTHKMVYEGGELVGREPIPAKNEDADRSK